jgi:hypothetical protein
MNQTPEQQIAVLSNEIDVKNAKIQSEQETNDEHICCECGCGVVLEKYKITIGDKKYCGVCGEYEEEEDSDEPKSPCYECSMMLTKENLQMGEYEQFYCETCWDERYDACDECYELVNKGQESPPYYSDENNQFQCVCDGCSDKWVKNVAKNRETRMAAIKKQQDMLAAFCQKECISEMLLVNKTTEQIYNMMYEY